LDTASKQITRVVWREVEKIPGWNIPG